MTRLKKCSFCGADIPPGRGLMYVKNDGSIDWYCRGKCYKSAVVLGRDPKRTAWARASRGAQR
ncbi:MAG: 50S ribosomal protein L24e [Fervidicoccaceae archaeon]